MSLIWLPFDFKGYFDLKIQCMKYDLYELQNIEFIYCQLQWKSLLIVNVVKFNPRNTKGGHFDPLGFFKFSPKPSKIFRLK